MVIIDQRRRLTITDLTNSIDINLKIIYFQRKIRPMFCLPKEHATARRKSVRSANRHPSTVAVAGRDCLLASLTSASVAYSRRESWRGKYRLGEGTAVSLQFYIIDKYTHDKIDRYAINVTNIG